SGESLPRAVPPPIRLFANSEGRGVNGMPLLLGRTSAPLGLSGSQPIKERSTEFRYPKRNSFTIVGDKTDTKEPEYTCGRRVVRPLYPSGHTARPDVSVAV